MSYFALKKKIQQNKSQISRNDSLKLFSIISKDNQANTVLFGIQQNNRLLIVIYSLILLFKNLSKLNIQFVKQQVFCLVQGAFFVKLKSIMFISARNYHSRSKCFQKGISVSLRPMISHRINRSLENSSGYYTISLVSFIPDISFKSILHPTVKSIFLKTFLCPYQFKTQTTSIPYH